MPQSPSKPATPFRATTDMSSSRTKFEGLIILTGGTLIAPSYSEVESGHPLERRLNRIERVIAAYHGVIANRAENRMSFSFESADAAVLAACEMQHRCASLPQVSAQRVSLRIGIHQVIARDRLQDRDDESREIINQLATLDDAVIISEAVGSRINAELKEITRPVAGFPPGVSAHQVDWRREIPPGAYGAESVFPSYHSAPPVSPFLSLSFGLKTLKLTPDSPLITIGRDPASDLVLTGVHVSRNHCRIERKIDRIVLIDRSTNGTCITNDEGKSRIVKNSAIDLYGKGLLFFGRPFNGERRGGARFEAI